jgi:hypothetical protein
VFLAERIFGIAITNSEGIAVPVRYCRAAHQGRSRANTYRPRLARRNKATTMDVWNEGGCPIASMPSSSV